MKLLLEFECEKCGEYQERFHRTENGTDYPVCKEEGCGGSLKKLISAPSGSGNSAHGFVRSTGLRLRK